MNEALRHDAVQARTRASDLQQDALALRDQARQARRRSDVAHAEIEAIRVLCALERFSQTLESWNGQAPTENEMTQWIDGIESALTEVERRLAALRPRG